MFARAAAAVVAGLGLMAGAAWGNVFTMPAGQKSLEFVTVGDAGNQPDTRYSATGYGAVGYNYQIGKYDVTAGQYAQFLSAVAATADPYNLYNPNMANSPSMGAYYVGCGITRTASSGIYTYSVTAGKEDMPVNWVSWGDTLRFANWLSNGQPTGPEGPGTTETGSYTLNGFNYSGIVRNPAATYVLPSEDEWYKAAYYKGGSTNADYWTYPTRSDTLPSNLKSATGTNNANFKATYTDSQGNDHYWLTDPANYLTPVGYFAGSPGPYGTFDMGGNVYQFFDTPFAWDASFTGNRGGSFDSVGTYLEAATLHGLFRNDELSYAGFRVGVVPEPSMIGLLCLSAIGLLGRRRLIR